MKRSKLSWSIILLLYLKAASYSNAQNATIDSIKFILPQQKDTSQINSHLKLANIYFRELGELDSMKHYSQLALTKSQELIYVRGGIDALTNMGIFYALNGEYTLSLTYWSKALKYATLIKDELSIADLEGKFGYSYQMMDDYENATKHFLKAASMFEDLNDYDELANVYQNIASVFATQEQYKESNYYDRKAIALLPKVKEKRIILAVYTGVASKYGEQGTVEKKYLDSSIVYAKLGLSIAIPDENYSRIAQLYSILSSDYFEKKEYDNFLLYAKKAHEYREYMGEDILFQTYIHYTDYYLATNNNTMAKKYIDSLLSSPLVEYDTYYKMVAVERGYLVNKKTGNINESFKNLEILRTLEDSVLRLEKNKVINDLEQKYNKAKNEKTILELGQEKEILNKKNIIAGLKVNLLIIGAVVLLLIIVIVVFIFNQKSLRQKKDLLESELRLNRSRINPHFLFNAMAALQSNLINERDPDHSALLLSKFAKMMRLTLEGSYDNMVTLESELEFIKQYLDIQKLRLRNKFEYSIDWDDEVDLSELKIPGMLLQPFVENSVEHGFVNIDYPGKLFIMIGIINNQLEITIDDNGTKSNSVKSNEFPSRATSIINDRLKLLSVKHKNKAFVEMHEKKPGFKVVITLPIITS